MDISEQIRRQKDRFRVFLILQVFSEPYADTHKHSLKRVFTSEVRIQKIDFLLRNPDYLAYELLEIAGSSAAIRAELKPIVRNIFLNREPVLRRLEMERFFFGAYEDIDDVIAFLASIDFIEFSSKRNSVLKTIDKQYYVTEYGTRKFETIGPELPALQWYVDRLELIKKYFGMMTGTQLKVSQYKIQEYRDTSFGEYINEITEKAKEKFSDLYGEKI